MSPARRFRDLCLLEMQALAAGDLAEWSLVNSERQAALQGLAEAPGAQAELVAAWRANRRLLEQLSAHLTRWGCNPPGMIYRRGS